MMKRLVPSTIAACLAVLLLWSGCDNQADEQPRPVVNPYDRVTAAVMRASLNHRDLLADPEAFRITVGDAVFDILEAEGLLSEEQRPVAEDAFREQGLAKFQGNDPLLAEIARDLRACPPMRQTEAFGRCVEHLEVKARGSNDQLEKRLSLLSSAKATAVGISALAKAEGFQRAGSYKMYQQGYFLQVQGDPSDPELPPDWDGYVDDWDLFQGWVLGTGIGWTAGQTYGGFVLGPGVCLLSRGDPRCLEVARFIGGLVGAGVGGGGFAMGYYYTRLEKWRQDARDWCGAQAKGYMREHSLYRRLCDGEEPIWYRWDELRYSG